MAEQKTAQQQVREQYKVAENTAQNLVRAWTDMVIASTEFSFDAFDKNLTYTQEMRDQTNRVAREALGTYRRMYQEGLKSWQGYVHGVNEIVNRSF